MVLWKEIGCESLGRWAADPGSIWLGPFNGSISTSYEEGKNLQLDWRNLADEDAANAAAKEFVRRRVRRSRSISAVYNVDHGFKQPLVLVIGRLTKFINHCQNQTNF
jgi:hypothetical protein